MNHLLWNTILPYCDIESRKILRYVSKSMKELVNKTIIFIMIQHCYDIGNINHSWRCWIAKINDNLYFIDDTMLIQCKLINYVLDEDDDVISENIEVTTFNIHEPSTLKFICDNSIANVDSLFCWSSLVGHLDILKMLCSQNTMQPNIKKHGVYALDNASENGYIEIVKFLCDQYFTTDYLREIGKYAIYLAFGNNHFDIVKFLYNKGVTTDVIKESYHNIMKGEYCTPALAKILRNKMLTLDSIINECS